MATRSIHPRLLERRVSVLLEKQEHYKTVLIGKLEVMRENLVHYDVEFPFEDRIEFVQRTTYILSRVKSLPEFTLIPDDVLLSCDQLHKDVIASCRKVQPHRSGDRSEKSTVTATIRAHAVER